MAEPTIPNDNPRGVTTWLYEEDKAELVKVAQNKKLHLGQLVRHILLDYLENNKGNKDAVSTGKN